jgi:DNA-binding NtrC family response regulator
MLVLAATALAALLALVGGPAVTAVDTVIYDRWLRGRVAVAETPELVIVARDGESTGRFGAGAWDRAVLARTLTALDRAGAKVIGLDVAVGQPAAPGRGGAASDAMLAQAIHDANVVVPLSPSAPRPASGAKLGHTIAEPDPDGIVRRVPVRVTLDAATIPPFGLALATARGGVAVNADARGQALVGFSGSGLPRGVKSVPFTEVWSSIEHARADALRSLVDDRVVLVLLEPPRPALPTPVGPLDPLILQAHLLRGLLAGDTPRELPASWTIVAALALALLGGVLWLSGRWWLGLGGVLAAAIGWTAAAVVAPGTLRLVLPLTTPLTALAAASVGGLLWSHLTAGARIRRLEAENARARETLVRQESAVEGLEEDLDAARADLGRAADELRGQLTRAREQEDATRRRLEALERELSTLRSAEPRRVALDDATQEARRRASEAAGIVTRDAAVLAAFADLERAADSSLPILILGEPGTGKELFARAAHRLGRRAAQPFVAVNMAAIPSDLFESQLFGHVKGAFTGAVADHRGFFEQASGGTIFLDEIGELRGEQQSKLLRVLQEKAFYRVGATRPTAVDVRVVAASNRALERGVAEGWFREDLYFRLKGLVLELPPLRARPDDVPLLAARLLAEAAAEARRDGLTLSEDAMAALGAHGWPGNVRELQNCLRQAVTLGAGPVLKREDLRLPPATGRAAAEPDTGDAAVLTALRRHGFDMQATARALGWDRSTVTQRLKGLGFRALVDAGGDHGRAALDLAGDAALARTVELKLREYHEHLLRSVTGFDSAPAAIAACRRRFKNLPDRHFRSLESLVLQHFDRR